jgi:hypothetical protein
LEKVRRGAAVTEIHKWLKISRAGGWRPESEQTPSKQIPCMLLIKKGLLGIIGFGMSLAFLDWREEL